jgi:hypothetical protein
VTRCFDCSCVPMEQLWPDAPRQRQLRTTRHCRAGSGSSASGAPVLQGLPGRESATSSTETESTPHTAGQAHELEVVDNHYCQLAAALAREAPGVGAQLAQASRAGRAVARSPGATAGGRSTRTTNRARPAGNPATAGANRQPVSRAEPFGPHEFTLWGLLRLQAATLPEVLETFRNYGKSHNFF